MSSPLSTSDPECGQAAWNEMRTVNKSLKLKKKKKNTGNKQVG